MRPLPPSGPPWVSHAALELGLVLRAFEELGLEITVRRSPAPPAWTRQLTFEAEHRETRTIYGNRRRAKERPDRNQMIRDGNLRSRTA